MPSETRTSSEPGRPWVSLALVALAIAVRLPHLDWGLPDLEEEALPLKKAFAMWGWAEGRLRLDPQTAGWPSLSFYLHLLLQHLHYGIGRALGLFADRQDYYLLQLDMSSLVVLARSLGVLAAAAITGIGARLGRRLAGTAGALLVGGLLAVAPLLVRQAQLVTPDILLAFFAALAFRSIVNVAEGNRRRDYLLAGLWIGLGASCKYTPVLLAPVLFVSHLMGSRASGRGVRRGGLDDARIWLAALAAAAAFVATSPYLALDPATFVRDLQIQRGHLGGGHFGQAGGPAWIGYLTGTLGPGMGWPALVVCLGGLFWAAWRRRGAWLLALLTVILFWGALGALETRFDRYMLPVMLPLALGAAGAWLALQEHRTARARPRIALAILLAVCLVPAVRGTVDDHRFRALPSTIRSAHAYIVDELGGGHYLAMEAYTPDLPRSPDVSPDDDPALARLSPAQRERWTSRPSYRVLSLPLRTARPELAAIYYELRLLLAYDFVVTSGAVRQRYEAEPERFARQVAFYDQLDRYARLQRAFAPGDDMRGPEIRIYAVDDDVRRRVVVAQGPLPQDFYVSFLDRVDTPRFRAFLQIVATHALQRRQDGIAERAATALYAASTADQRDEIRPLLAETRVLTGRYASARDLLVEVLRHDPDNAAAEGYLGMSLLQLGDTEGARAHLRRCLALAPEDAAGRSAAAWARKTLDDLDED